MTGGVTTIAIDEIEVRYTVELRHTIKLPAGRDHRQAISDHQAISDFAQAIRAGGRFYLDGLTPDGTLTPVGEIVPDSIMIRFLYGPDREDLEDRTEPTQGGS